MSDRDYFLGTADIEIERLGLQHQLWRPYAMAAWDRAGLAAGWHVVDIGSGPGFATLDLAERVGPTGSVLAIERSHRFRRFLLDQARAAGLENVRAVDADLGVDPLGAAGLDAAWCRWVACFLPSPARLVERIRDALRRGGVAVFQEYVDYSAWRLLPAVDSFDAFVETVIRSWRAAGGEPDVARDLPAHLRAAGFRISSATPLQFAARPGEPIWEWPATFVRSGVLRLQQVGSMSNEQARRVLADFEAAERDPDTLMLTPTVLEIIAEAR